MKPIVGDPHRLGIVLRAPPGAEMRLDQISEAVDVADALATRALGCHVAVDAAPEQHEQKPDIGRDGDFAAELGRRRLGCDAPEQRVEALAEGIRSLERGDEVLGREHAQVRPFGG